MATQSWSSRISSQQRAATVPQWHPQQPLNVVADVSHYNNIDLTLARRAGVVGIIHKATQGLTFKDPLWGKRLLQARELNLYFGSYHFGTGDGSGRDQANFFLDMVSPAFPSLLVLDLEQNSQGSTMSLQQAQEFVDEIQTLTGKLPTIYAGDFLRDALPPVLRSGYLTPEALLFKCQLWVADYRPEPSPMPGWEAWSLWQYTDAEHGNPPHDLAGIRECDRDIFNGSEQDLQKFFEG